MAIYILFVFFVDLMLMFVESVDDLIHVLIDIGGQD